MTSVDVLVLGAGPAGLMAALDVVRSGRSCAVLEASDHVGGMAGSFEIAGQRVDYGSHRLHPATPPELLGMINELLGDDLQVRPRAGRLDLGGRWVGFPLRAGELLRALPPRLATKMVFDASRASATGWYGASRRRSFDDEVRARFGSTVADQFYGPYAEKLYGLAPDALDRELAQRRISASSPTAIARRLVKARNADGRVFLYPRRGYGQIAERLAEAADEAGVDVRLSAPADSIRINANGVEVTTDHGESFEAGIVLSTIPLPTLAKIVDPKPDEEVQRALSALRTRAMLLVYLVLDRPRYTRFDAHYVPGDNTTIARLSEPKNYRDGDDPKDRTVLCAEIACWPTDDIWSWSADDLAAMVACDLQRLGLPASNHVGAELRRLPAVYPVYDRAHRAERAVVDEWTRSTGRLVTLGRQGLRVIDNVHHVMAMGSAAASSVDQNGQIRSAEWHRHLDRFAANVVED